MEARIEVFPKDSDARAGIKLGKIHAMGFGNVKGLQLADIYTISSPNLAEADLQKCGELLSNPVTQ